MRENRLSGLMRGASYILAPTLPLISNERRVGVADMPRKLRLEFPGAIYHVINRGNYRAWVFKDEGTKAAFEACLFEACTRCGWVLHAFVVMRNLFMRRSRRHRAI
jgi:hypothetical protein